MKKALNKEEIVKVLDSTTEKLANMLNGGEKISSDEIEAAKAFTMLIVAKAAVVGAKFKDPNRDRALAMLERTLAMGEHLYGINTEEEGI
jgi:hypothetical protein